MKLTQVPFETEQECTERLEADILWLRQRTWEKASAQIRSDNVKRFLVGFALGAAAILPWLWLMFR